MRTATVFEVETRRKPGALPTSEFNLLAIQLSRWKNQKADMRTRRSAISASLYRFTKGKLCSTDHLLFLEDNPWEEGRVSEIEGTMGFPSPRT